MSPPRDLNAPSQLPLSFYRDIRMKSTGLPARFLQWSSRWRGRIHAFPPPFRGVSCMSTDTAASTPSPPPGSRPAFKLKDLNEWKLGRDEIRLAEFEMPGLHGTPGGVWAAQAAGRREDHMGSLHMTVQTAVLIETLTYLGADVRLGCRATSSPPGPRRRPAVVGGPQRHPENPKGCAGLRLKGERWRSTVWCTEAGPPLARRLRPEPCCWMNGGDASLLVHNGTEYEAAGQGPGL